MECTANIILVVNWCCPTASLTTMCLFNVNLGFSADPVKQAITDQLATLPYYSTFRGTTNDVVIELSYDLAEFFAPDGMSTAFLHPGALIVSKQLCVSLASITSFEVRLDESSI